MSWRSISIFYFILSAGLAWAPPVLDEAIQRLVLQQDPALLVLTDTVAMARLPLTYPSADPVVGTGSYGWDGSDTDTAADLHISLTSLWDFEAIAQFFQTDPLHNLVGIPIHAGSATDRSMPTSFLLVSRRALRRDLQNPRIQLFLLAAGYRGLWKVEPWLQWFRTSLAVSEQMQVPFDGHLVEAFPYLEYSEMPDRERASAAAGLARVVVTRKLARGTAAVRLLANFNKWGAQMLPAQSALEFCGRLLSRRPR